MKQLRTWLPALALLVVLILAPSSALAQGSSACSQAANCVEQFDQSGTYTVPTHLTQFVIKAGQTSITIDPTNGDYNDGCYDVQFTASEPGGDIDTVAWQQLFDEDNNPNNCQEISNVEIWWYVSPTAITLKNMEASSNSAGGIPVWAFIGVFAFLAFSIWYVLGGRKLLKQIFDHYRYRWGRGRR